MARLRQNFLNGTLSALATNVATTLTSAAFANLPAITAADDMSLVLDPLGTAGAPELVRVTAHTGASTSITVVRGQEGTTARQHASGIAWRHSATAADLVTVCTSATRPTVGLYEGRLIYETDTDTVQVYSGSAWMQVSQLGAWTSYTPTLAQGATSNIAKTVTYGKYQRIGRLIVAEGFLAITGTGTASQQVLVSLPVTAAHGTAVVVGGGWIFDSSANTTYPALTFVASTTQLAFTPLNVTIGVGWNGLGLGGGVGTGTFGAALASGDQISFGITYEAAS